MSFCWTVLLPIVIAFVVLVPCILYSFEIIPANISLLAVPFMVKKDSLNKDKHIKNSEDLVSLTAHSVYQNVQDKTTLALIRKNLTNVGGVYAIVHNQTKKLYVGSSMNLARRLTDYVNNQSSNLLLQCAINKYGLNNFYIYILELLPVNENLTSEELGVTLIKMEQKHLDSFNDKYNINPKAGKTRLGAKHSEATRELMSELRKENPHFLNKTHSPEILAQMSARMKGSNNPMFGKPVTESNKKLISDLFRKPIYLYDANTLTLIAKYDKHKDLVDTLKISPKTLIKYKDSGEVLREKYIISSTELSPCNGTTVLQSGSSKIVVTFVLLSSGNTIIYDYDKLVGYLNSLINQIDISKYNLANWDILSPGKGGISIPKMDMPTPKIPDWLDKLSSTISDSGWSPLHIPNYHSIYDKLSGLISQIDNPLFLLLGVFLCIVTFFLIPGINTISKSLSSVTEGIKYSLSTGISSNIYSTLSSTKDYLFSKFNLYDYLPSEIADSKIFNYQDFIDFNNQISLLSNLGLGTLSATLGTSVTVYVYDRIINRPANRLYLYEEDIRDRFADLWASYYDHGFFINDPLVDSHDSSWYGENFESRFDYGFFAEPIDDLRGNEVAWSSFRRFLEYSDFDIPPSSSFRIDLENRWYADIAPLFIDYSDDQHMVFRVRHMELLDDINSLVRRTEFRILTLLQVTEELSRLLNCYNININPPLDVNPLTIANPENILIGDEGYVNRLTINIRDCDQRFRSLNTEIARNLAELYQWEQIITIEPEFRPFYSRNEQISFRIYERDRLHRLYRLLVIYRVFPDLARRYSYFNLLDL